MRGEAQGPMRTEDDVRAALVALEDLAPSADAALRAAQDAARRRRGPARGPRLPRSPRWPQLVMGIATVAVIAGLAIALLPGGAPAGRGRPAKGPAASRGGLPSAAWVGRSMLTAFSAATGDILYSTQVSARNGVVLDIYQDWNWPARLVPGQLARWREAFSLRTSTTKALLLTEGDGFSWIAPRGNPNYVYGHLTVVCYPGTGQTGCGYGNTETPVGTWSEHNGRFVNPGNGTLISPAQLARQIARGRWRVTGRTHLDGQAAIELTETRTGEFLPLPTVLWVNAHTYLPIRMTAGTGTVTRADWSYLKPTRASLAVLRVPIPAGLPRSG
jgi:hypothetical protein